MVAVVAGAALVEVAMALARHATTVRRICVGTIECADTFKAAVLATLLGKCLTNRIPARQIDISAGTATNQAAAVVAAVVTASQLEVMALEVAEVLVVSQEPAT